MWQFLDNNSIPTITQDHLHSLNSPISPQEVSLAISTLTNGKAPGPDDLFPTLLAVYQAIWDACLYLPLGHQAFIKFIVNKDKDLTEPSSYHSISFLNINIKLFSKIVVSRHYAIVDSPRADPLPLISVKYWWCLRMHAPISLKTWRLSPKTSKSLSIF